MIATIALFCLLSTAAAFQPAAKMARSTALDAKSKSVPFLEQPSALDGTMAGDVGFDPIGFSSYWSDVSSTISIASFT